MKPAYVRIASSAIALACVLGTGGCIVVHDRDDRWVDDDVVYVDPPQDTLDEPALVTIDVGAEVGAVEPGAGAGVFIETDAEGHWRVTTTCDTDVSGYLCDYELYLQAEGLTVDAVQTLEVEDDFDDFEDEVDVYFSTGADFDGVTLDATPGAPLLLTMYLDGASQPSLVYWVGGGIQNEGAPTNPVIFQP